MVLNLSVQIGKNMVPVWSEKRNLSIFVCFDAVGLQWNFKECIHLNMSFATFFPPGYPVDAFVFRIFLNPLVLGNASS